MAHKLDISHYGRCVASKERVGQPYPLLVAHLLALVVSNVCLREDLIYVEVLTVFVSKKEKPSRRRKLDKGYVFEKRGLNFGKERRRLHVSDSDRDYVRLVYY